MLVNRALKDAAVLCVDSVLRGQSIRLLEPELFALVRKPDEAQRLSLLRASEAARNSAERNYVTEYVERVCGRAVQVDLNLYTLHERLKARPGDMCMESVRARAQHGSLTSALLLELSSSSSSKEPPPTATSRAHINWERLALAFYEHGKGQLAPLKSLQFVLMFGPDDTPLSVAAHKSGLVQITLGGQCKALVPTDTLIFDAQARPLPASVEPTLFTDDDDFEMDQDISATELTSQRIDIFCSSSSDSESEDDVEVYIYTKAS
jgi:hypothetical protein